MREPTGAAQVPSTQRASALRRSATHSRSDPQPGQALAYKMGELTIWELRHKAEKALGDKFDIREFHDAVLDQGGLPLDVLAEQVDAYIAAKKAE